MQEEDLGMQAEAVRWLKERGVTLADIAAVVQEVQRAYFPHLTQEECEESILAVLAKREVQNALMVGLALDVLAERGLLPEPLLSIVRRDDGLFGVDEILALAITNVYGSIGLTNFGYLDKQKIGVIGRLHRSKDRGVYTFLDDLVAGIAAAAAARIAHRHRSQGEERTP